MPDKEPNKDGWPPYAVSIFGKLKDVEGHTAVQAEQIKGLRDNMTKLPCEAMQDAINKIDQKAESAKKWNRVLALIGGALAAVLGLGRFIPGIGGGDQQ